MIIETTNWLPVFVATFLRPQQTTAETKLTIWRETFKQVYIFHHTSHTAAGYL